MIRGLYTSGWGMMALNKKMDVIANNLANVNTTGYKKDTVIYQSFPELLTKRIHDTRSTLNPTGKIGTLDLGSDVGEVFTYYTQGSINKTGSKLDLAIKGADSAFFTVKSPGNNGKEYLTRDGSFDVNSEGYLVTKEGYQVMGAQGSIKLNGEDFTVRSDGAIVQNNKVVDKLLIKEFVNTMGLRKVGDNLIEDTGATSESTFSGTVEQGCLEQSNVDTVHEMVDMISVMRSYEANQKILQAEDSTLDKAVNEVGAVR